MLRLKRAPRKALASIGVGPLAPCLEIALSSFETFADRHGYEVVIGDGKEAEGRPPAWAKVRLLQRLLDVFDFVLWVDADALIIDTDRDLEPYVARRHFQGMVRHNHPLHGEVPNTGVWALRSGTKAQHFLREVWDQREFIDHPWWDNAAVISLLGYELPREVNDHTADACRLTRDSQYLGKTSWLGKCWNSIELDQVDTPYIKHWAGEPLERRLTEMTAEASRRLRG